jgi:hypothetical protein
VTGAKNSASKSQSETISNRGQHHAEPVDVVRV